MIQPGSGSRKAAFLSLGAGGKELFRSRGEGKGGVGKAELQG